MRRYPLLCVLALVFACGPDSDPTTVPSLRALPALNDISKLDLDGMPDLIVDENSASQQWVVRDENLPATYCSVIEGGVTPGLRRLVRFTVMTPNVGDADLYVGSPLDHYNAGDGLFYPSTCAGHNHFHFNNYASYKLIEPATGKVWRAAKRGFCMLDTDPAPAWYGEPPRDKNFLNCGSLTADGFQGISHGWVDTYRFFLGGQYFVLDGGDGQDPVPPGNYIIEVEVNPGYKGKGGKCQFALDANTGLCHNFAESDYSNNVTQFAITIPSHVGRSGYGPGKDLQQPQGEPAEH